VPVGIFPASALESQRLPQCLMLRLQGYGGQVARLPCSIDKLRRGGLERAGMKFLRWKNTFV
jgi:hypothetical protein